MGANWKRNLSNKIKLSLPVTKLIPNSKLLISMSLNKKVKKTIDLGHQYSID